MYYPTVLLGHTPVPLIAPFSAWTGYTTPAQAPWHTIALLASGQLPSIAFPGVLTGVAVKPTRALGPPASCVIQPLCGNILPTGDSQLAYHLFSMLPRHCP